MQIAESSSFLLSDHESTWPMAQVVRRRSVVAIGAWVLLAVLAIIAYRLLIAR